MMQAGLVAEFVVDYCSVMLECISRDTVSCAAASRMTSGDRRDPVCVCGTTLSIVLSALRALDDLGPCDVRCTSSGCAGALV
jgi:hypothetical protein